MTIEFWIATEAIMLRIDCAVTLFGAQQRIAWIFESRAFDRMKKVARIANQTETGKTTTYWQRYAGASQ